MRACVPLCVCLLACVRVVDLIRFERKKVNCIVTKSAKRE